MADLFNQPKFQAFDTTGLPLSGGKVYSYDAGTATPKATYSDQVGTVPNTNPVVLDSRGEATIYFSGTGSYKIVLKDSSDNLVWTMDNLTGMYNASVLGTAAAADTGTDADEVPLNSDLGTGAYKDSGVDIGDLVELQDVSGSAGLPAVDGSQLTGLASSQLSDVSTGQLMPTGAYLVWSTNTPPAGYLECNGAAVSRTTYSALFAVIGATYGNGDGSTTFNLPDLRGYFLRGWDHGAGNDPDAASRTDRGDGTSGDYIGTKQAGAVEAHNHPVYGELTLQTVGSGRQLNGSSSSSNVTTGNTGGNETRPVNINVMYCIKY